MMKQAKLALAITAVLLLALISVGHKGAVLANGELVPGQYIVVLKNDVAPSAFANNFARSNNAQVKYVYDAALNGFTVSNVSDAALKALQSNPNVAYINQDRVVTMLPITTFGGPTNGVTQAQTVPTGIARIDGGLSSTVSGNGSGSVNVDVAVIDTGIQTNHPDLNVVGGKNCSSGSSYADGNGHGTHVSGTIAAKDDATGVVGVAPGARLWAVRVLNNQGSGTSSSVICGINWVTANAATIEVANMSLGGTGTDSACGGSDAYHNAICNSVNAGVTYAVAAGNETDNAANHVPAAYDEVITVSALADFNGTAGGGGAATCRTDVDDSFADFSNYGSDVDIIAPGVCIYSTWKGSAYNTISGTSMATPHVTGAAALYKANNPSATPAQVKTALQNAGNLNWNNADDHDSTKEKLLNVGGF